MAIGPEFSDQIALGYFFTLTEVGAGPGATLRGQNFFVDSDVNYNGAIYSFLPFGFSGATVNRNGDNQSTSIMLPNNTLVRTLLSRVMQGEWLGGIDTALVDPADSNNYTTLASYTGQVVAATVNGPAIEVELGSILDAVGGDIPRRRVTEDLFGPLPSTASVRLQ